MDHTPVEVPTESDSPNAASARTHEVSGTKVVFGMILFALTLIGILFAYSFKHSQPFRPLQRAIRAEYPKSQPRVEGGQRKIHRETPKILRITMQVQFDPESDDERARVDSMISQLRELASRHIDLTGYDVFEVHLVQLRPEQTARKLTITHELGRPM